MDIVKSVRKFYFNSAVNELRLMHKNFTSDDISYNSLLYLDIISHTKGCTSSYLASMLQVSKSAITMKLNELIKHGYIKKTQSEEDKRIFYLSLTEKQCEEFALYNEHLLNATKKIKQSFQKEEIELFCRILESIGSEYEGELQK